MMRVAGFELRLEIPEDPDPLEGRTLAGFELQEVIGKGSYGTVYRALQVNLARPVAVKVLSQEYSNDPKQVDSFLTEARNAGRLNHPNLVQVHDVQRAEGHHLLVMELMTTSTSDQLREEGPFHESQLLAVLKDICRALAYAESQRLVHRDVKPDNILVNDEGSYKLADLGIAAPMSANGQAHQERIFGSPHYVAPEQARGGAIDARADLYALGASAWHLATGRTLFDGNNRQLVQHQLNTPAPELRKIAQGISPTTAGFIHKLLEKNPDKRPATAAEALRQIELLHAGIMARLSTPRPKRPRISRIRRMYRR